MMKKFILFILSAFLLQSCIIGTFEKREYWEMRTELSLGLDIMQELQEDLEHSLIYDWDESVYGKLGYTLSDSVEVVIMTEGNVVSEDSYLRGKEYWLDLNLDGNYNLLFYTKGKRNTFYYNGEDYISSYNTASQDTSKFNYGGKIYVRENCDEILSIYGEDVFKNFDPKHAKIETIDGMPTYVYYIDINMEPVTYIYVIQVIIFDDDHSIPMNVIACDYIGINGFSQSCNLFEREGFGERCVIESYNVKPYKKEINYGICAERFVTYGLNYDYGSSWGDSKDYYVGVIFTLSDGKKSFGKVNVSDKINAKPYGGVINVILNNSEISNGSVVVDDETDMGIIVNDWNVTIVDIDF